MLELTEKYDKISGHYNKTRKADRLIVGRLFDHLNCKPGGTYLDIGCGTGNYSIALSGFGIDLIGVDPSPEMLRQARVGNKKVEWKTGRAEEIPLEDMSVDGCFAVLTIHHWKDLDRAFREINRVIRQGSRFVIFTSSAVQMRGYWLNRYFPAMIRASCQQMPEPDLVNQYLTGNGFSVLETEKYFVLEDVADFFLYSGKHNPAIYLDPVIRRGISSFSLSSAANEIKSGLIQLAADIESGKIDTIIKDYENDSGDYLFLITEKINPNNA